MPPLQARPRPAWDLLQDQSFRRLLLMNWALSSCWDVHAFVVPILGHERGLSASVIGSILGGFAMAAVVVRLLPLLVSICASGWWCGAPCWALVCCLCCTTLMPGPWSMSACSVLLGLVLGSVQPMVMSMLHRHPEARHGQALGLRMMAINASSVMMPMMFGSLGAVLGVSALFLGGGGHGGGSHHACPGCWGVIRLQTGSAQSLSW